MSANRKPDIVLIMTDQQKASSLPMYGNPTVRTPNLSRFAAGAMVFTHAFTSCPLCVPARVSAFTGQYPSAHGSPDNNRLMAPGRNHLLKRLKEAGYATGLAGKNHCFRKEDLEYFDRVAECWHHGPKTDDPVYAEPSEWLRSCRDVKGCWGWTRNPFPPERLGTHWTVDKGIEFLEAHRDGPFFLWLSIPDPHVPFQAPEPYASMYPPETVDMPAFREGEMDNKPLAQRIDSRVMCADAVSEETIRNVRSIYYGMNSYVDDELGRFFDAMEASGKTNEALVIYVSDHGEYLGEHRMIRKSKSAYDALTHIPFIVRAPQGVQGVSDAFVSLEDIMPTVLRAAGLDCPGEVQGRDLMPLLRGEVLPDPGFAYGESGGRNEPEKVDLEAVKTCTSPHSPDFKPRLKLGGFGKMRYVRTREWKLAAYVDDVYELYDLRNDPHELVNRYEDASCADVRRRLERILIEQMMRVSSPEVSADIVS